MSEHEGEPGSEEYHPTADDHLPPGVSAAACSETLHKAAHACLVINDGDPFAAWQALLDWLQGDEHLYLRRDLYKQGARQLLKSVEIAMRGATSAGRASTEEPSVLKTAYAAMLVHDEKFRVRSEWHDYLSTPQILVRKQLRACTPADGRRIIAYRRNRMKVHDREVRVMLRLIAATEAAGAKTFGDALTNEDVKRIYDTEA